MRLVPRSITLEVDGKRSTSPLLGEPADSDPSHVFVAIESLSPEGFEWVVQNVVDHPVAVRSVAVDFEVEEASAPLRLFRHGYQSWSPTDVATVGVDRDPSAQANLEFLQAAHHSDQRTVLDESIRSEWVTLLTEESRSDDDAVLVGFLGGSQHDGTIWVLPTTSGVAVVRVEAFLGGAFLEAGERRSLHAVRIDARSGVSPSDKLDAFADEVGRREAARVGGEYQVGWCSWYQYFHDVTEADIRGNLAEAASWPFDVFQIDDGYQAAIGDWLQTNEKFPSGLGALAEAISSTSMTPGIWLAPFLAAPDSMLLADHPDFAARHREGGPLRTWWNPPWGGGDEGFMYGLDTTNPSVLTHLEDTARSLREMGFRYLKLDFTFSPSVDGLYRDPSLTPAQRVRAGFEAIRRGAGDDCFLLACGVPLSNVVGVVDGVRIGQDVAPLWALDRSDEVVPGYLDTQPATRLAAESTMRRAFLHRRAWLNDPDCVMLRHIDTELSTHSAASWATLIGFSGGMVLVSDDLQLLDGDSREMLEKVIERGRTTDQWRRTGGVFEVDVLSSPWPTTISASGDELVLDLETGRASEL